MAKLKIKYPGVNPVDVNELGVAEKLFDELFTKMRNNGIQVNCLRIYYYTYDNSSIRSISNNETDPRI